VARLLESKTRDLAELTIAFALIQIAEWVPNPLQRVLFWTTLAWVITTTILAKPSAQTLGLRVPKMRSLWIVPVALLLGAVASGLASQLHTLHSFSGSMLSGRLRGYLIWTFLQQFMLQDYFLLRVLRLIPDKPAAVLVAATLFASAHIPNPLLIVTTFVWGVAACTLFLRYRDLYSVGIAHCVLGICLAVCVPENIHHGMRVGLGYRHYRPHAEPAQRSQIDQIVSTDACVIAEATSLRSARHALP
jgi:membrane protease YdiL (CAAX protease family)